MPEKFIFKFSRELGFRDQEIKGHHFVHSETSSEHGAGQLSPQSVLIQVQRKKKGTFLLCILVIATSLIKYFNKHTEPGLGNL